MNSTAMKYGAIGFSLSAIFFAHDDAKAANAISWSATRPVEISDPQYQMTAYTLQIPAGWKFAGTIARAPGCHTPGASMQYTMQSPDNAASLVILPAVTWSWSDSPSMQKIMAQTQCPAITIDSAASFLVNIAIPNIDPKARIVEVLPLLPEGQAVLKDQLEKARQQNAAMARQYGQPPQKLNIDGARIRVRTERDGRPAEEMISAVIDCFGSQMPALYGQPASERRNCTSRGTVIVRAPQGQLDAMMASPQFAAISKSIQPNPEWQNRLARDQQAAFQRMQAENNRQFQQMMQKGRDDNERLLERGRAFNNTLRQGTDRAIAADRARQNAIDESAHATALSSLDRQEFRNPSTGQIIEANNQFNHQWMSSDGNTLIQTNDHSYDPNGQVYPGNQSWTELAPR